MLNIKTLFWVALFSISLFFLYEVKSILAPFIASMIIGYLLNPLTVKLENFGVHRVWTVTLIVSSFFLLLTLFLLELTPILFEQVKQFVAAIPQYEEYVSKHLLINFDNFIARINPKLSAELHSQLSQLSNKFFEYILSMVHNIFDSSIAILNVVGLILFTPILVFYLLRDWPAMVDEFHKLLPLHQKDVILEECRQIDSVLSACLRGQLTVCVILSAFYMISLSLVGLNYALLIGIIAGFLAIIPYIGLIVGGSICVLVSILQFADLKYVYISLGIFLAGHICESYVITPKLVGEKVGLHPVWIIFALMAGGSLFGFVGMCLAIPIAAILGVVIRSLVSIYFSSKIYTL